MVQSHGIEGERISREAGFERNGDGPDFRKRAQVLPVNLEELPELVERSFEAVAEVEAWDGERGPGTGTGFLAMVDGDEGDTSDFVITNAHVAEGGSELKVFFKDAKESRGQLVGTHPMVDIALFRLDEPRGKALALRGKDDYRLGEFVIALGHPQRFSWTVTAGLISGLDRPTAQGNSGLPITMLQTSAEINFGNSGGPLIGLDGKVVGVNTSGITRQESMFKVNFAVPGHSARLAALAILDAKDADHVPRPWTGLPIHREPWKAPQDIIASFGVKGGARVDGTPRDGSPASEAGLRDGDVVIGIDDREVDDPGDVFTWMLDPSCLNREFELRFLRDGEIQTTMMRAVDRDS